MIDKPEKKNSSSSVAKVSFSKSLKRPKVSDVFAINKNTNLVNNSSTPTNEKSVVKLTKIQFNSTRSKSPKERSKQRKVIFTTQELEEKMKQKLIKNCKTFDQWKKRNELEPTTKIFICHKEYPDIISALLERGWVVNPDYDSPFFDLKYVVSGNNLDYRNLLNGQVVNHFEKNTEITTKVSLCRNLRNLIWFRNVDIDSFYPRCYDLTDNDDIEDFHEEFKTNKVSK